MKFTQGSVLEKFKSMITNDPAFKFGMKDIARIRKEMETLIGNLSELRLHKEELKGTVHRLVKEGFLVESEIDPEVGEQTSYKWGVPEAETARKWAYKHAEYLLGIEKAKGPVVRCLIEKHQPTNPWATDEVEDLRGFKINFDNKPIPIRRGSRRPKRLTVPSDPPIDSKQKKKKKKWRARKPRVGIKYQATVPKLTRICD